MRKLICGANRIVEGTTHYIRKEEPEAVVEAGAEMVAAVRAAKR